MDYESPPSPTIAAIDAVVRFFRRRHDDIGDIHAAAAIFADDFHFPAVIIFSFEPLPNIILFWFWLYAYTS